MKGTGTALKKFMGQLLWEAQTWHKGSAYIIGRFATEEEALTAIADFKRENPQEKLPKGWSYCRNCKKPFDRASTLAIKGKRYACKNCVPKYLDTEAVTEQKRTAGTKDKSPLSPPRFIVACGSTDKIAVLSEEEYQTYKKSGKLPDRYPEDLNSPVWEMYTNPIWEEEEDDPEF